MARGTKMNKVIEGDVLTVTYAPEEDGTEVPSLAVDINSFSDEIKLKLAMHGLSQKTGDAAAGVKSPGESRGAMERVVQELVAGNWTFRSPASPKYTQIATALARVTNKTLDEASEIIAKLTDEQLADLKRHAQIVQAIKAIKLEKAQEELVAAQKAAAEAEELNL